MEEQVLFPSASHITGKSCEAFDGKMYHLCWKKG